MYHLAELQRIHPLAVPTSSIVTKARPDDVVITSDSITLIELTVPLNSPEALENAKRYKENKDNYQMLLGDLESLHYTTEFVTVEIRALGHWLP